MLRFAHGAYGVHEIIEFTSLALRLRFAPLALRSRNLLHGSLSCASPSFAQ
jgi:hypothetical protein